MADFWSAVLDVPARIGTDPGDVYAELVLQPGLSLLLLEVPEPRAVENRLHLDLSPRGADQTDEVARVEAPGGRTSGSGRT